MEAQISSIHSPGSSLLLPCVATAHWLFLPYWIIFTLLSIRLWCQWSAGPCFSTLPPLLLYLIAHKRLKIQQHVSDSLAASILFTFFCLDVFAEVRQTLSPYPFSSFFFFLVRKTIKDELIFNSVISMFSIQLLRLRGCWGSWWWQLFAFLNAELQPWRVS
jgi:hypothetical protein